MILPQKNTLKTKFLWVPCPDAFSERFYSLPRGSHWCTAVVQNRRKRRDQDWPSGSDGVGGGWERTCLHSAINTVFLALYCQRCPQGQEQRAGLSYYATCFCSLRKVTGLICIQKALDLGAAIVNGRKRICKVRCRTRGRLCQVWGQQHLRVSNWMWCMERHRKYSEWERMREREITSINNLKGFHWGLY